MLFESKTDEWHLVIFENELYGRVMALDGIIQTTEKDEFVYHELMTHVPILSHGNARKVLIIGGGDGGCLREALKHSSVDQVTMVEIDRGVVDMSIEYFPMISDGAFDNPRTNLVIADGARFVKECGEKFDVIAIDSTDPIGPGEVLFTREFYSDCKGLLNPGGVMVNMNAIPFLDSSSLVKFCGRVKGLFANPGVFVAPVPAYIGGYMTFGWSTDDATLRNVPMQELQSRYAKSAIKTRFLTPELHAGLFNPPAFIKELLEQNL